MQSIARMGALLGALLLANCAAPAPVVVTKVVVEKETIPATLLDCQPPAPVPVLPPSEDAAVRVAMKYTAVLYNALVDCSDKAAAAMNLQAPPTK